MKMLLDVVIFLAAFELLFQVGGLLVGAFLVWRAKRQIGKNSQA